MREVTRIVYEAFDGEMFDSEAKCSAYEKENSWRRIVGLTEDQVCAALNGDGDEEIAAAIKTVGYQIANLNRGKRAPKSNPADKEPFLPHPVGGEDGGPPEPPEPYPDPMTAEQALNHTR